MYDYVTNCAKIGEIMTGQPSESGAMPKISYKLTKFYGLRA